MTTVATERPFVHIFRTDNMKYVYDVNSGGIARINDLYWALLSNWDRSDEDVATVAGEGASAGDVAAVRVKMAKLAESAELFSTKRPKSVRSPHTRQSAERKLSEECHQLILCASEICNMRCKYCYYTSGRENERGHGSRLMSWETARKALDFYLARSHKTMEKYKAQQAEIKAGRTFRANELIPKPCIGFYGGEPLVNWPLMKRVIEHVRALPDGDEYLVNCTINGTLLTAEIMAFAAKHAVTLSISLDGPEKYHDRYRRFADGGPTWEAVVSKLRYLKRNMPEYYDNHVHLLGVMAPPGDMKDLLDFVLTADFLPKRGIRFNGVEPNSPPCFWSCLPAENREFKSEELWHEYIDRASRGQLNESYRPEDEAERKRLTFLKHMFNLAISHAYCRTRFMFEGKNLVPDSIANNFGMCLPGQERIFVTVDGKLLPCERLPSEAPDLAIGDLDTGFDMDRIMNLCEGNPALLEDRCVKCWNVRMCTVGCHRILGPDGRLSRSAKEEACEESLRKSHHSLCAMCSVLEKNPDALRFLDNM